MNRQKIKEIAANQQKDREKINWFYKNNNDYNDIDSINLNQKNNFNPVKVLVNSTKRFIFIDK